MVPYCSCCLCLYIGSAIMLVTYFVNFRKLNDHLFGKELFILFAASAFRKLSSIYVFSYFPFGFEGRIWDLIVSVPDHCLSFYFAVPTRNSALCMVGRCNFLFLYLLIKRRGSGMTQGRSGKWKHWYFLRLNTKHHASLICIQTG